MEKKKRIRKPNPAWWWLVDRDMRLYLVWERAIKHQENIILTHRLTGARITPTYELREGGRGGATLNEAERIAIDIDFAERKIIAGTAYREHIEEITRQAAANDPAKELFMKRYWLTANMSVRGRIGLVIDALPFLACKNWETGQMTRPNRNFYTWRERMYEELGLLLGYGEEMEK